MPVMLYDVPGRTGTQIALETYEQAIRLETRRRGQGRRRRLRPRRQDHRPGLRALLRRRRRQPRLARPRRRRLRERRRPRLRRPAQGDGPTPSAPATTPRPSQIFTRLLPAIDAVMGVANYGATTAKAALQLLGVLDNRNVRAPLVAAGRRRGRGPAGRTRRLRPPVRNSMSHPHPELSTPAQAAQGRTPDHPARRTRRGRSQHDRLRVRRPAAHRRLRGALPRGPPPRRRPDPPRLRLDPGPARRRSRRSS